MELRMLNEKEKPAAMAFFPAGREGSRDPRGDAPPILFLGAKKRMRRARWKRKNAGCRNLRLWCKFRQIRWPRESVRRVSMAPPTLRRSPAVAEPGPRMTIAVGRRGAGSDLTCFYFRALRAAWHLTCLRWWGVGADVCGLPAVPSDPIGQRQQSPPLPG